MADTYKRVYANVPIQEGNENEIEIYPEYVYLTIPAEWVCLYHKLLGYLADFGEEVIKDCQAACKGTNLYVIQCWNMFQSAIACRAIGSDDKADLFIKYIEAQLDNIYKNSNKEIYCGDNKVAITPDGQLVARVSCNTGNNSKFFVDPETGVLYQQYIKDNEHDIYIIDGQELIRKEKV